MLFRSDEVIKDFTPAAANGTYSDSLSVDDGDIYYVLQGSSKQLAGCYGWDTVYVYKIPNAPIIEIAAAETPHDLKLTFNVDETEEALVDGYRLMHNKWDGYAIESEYSEKAVRAHDNPIYDLKEADLDTLEFFYVMVSRTIDIRQNGTKKTYFSLPSDTVGYKVDVLLKNTDGTSNNPIAWMFDMPNIQTSEDLFNTNKKYIKAIRAWVMEQQSMTLATTKHPLAGRPNQPDYRNIFDLEVGKVYEIAVDTSFNVIQYGKLGDRLIVDFENAPKEVTNNNLICVPLHKVYLKASDAMYDEIVDMADAIRMWVFADQSWTHSTMKNPLAGRPNQPKYRNVFRVIPSLAIQIPYNRNANQTVWE